MKIELPDKLFGVDSHLLPIMVPTVLLVLAVLMITNLVIIPKISEISEVSARTEAAKLGIKQMQDKRDYVASLDTEELQKNSQLISNALLPERNAYMLVNVVRTIADRYQFNVDSFRIVLGEIGTKASGAKVTGVEGVMKTPINLVLVGPKSSYLAFISSIERSLPVMSIDQFTMKSSGEAVIIDLVVAAYYVEDKTKLTVDKVSLGDLVLKKAESELIEKIAEYKVVVKTGEIEGQIGRGTEFTKYNRTDPFNL